MKQSNKTMINYAKPEDAYSISLIENECFSSPWSIKQIEDEIKNENAVFLISKTDNILSGYISGKLILDEFYISNVAVDKNYRRQGIGFLLISELLNILSVANCTFATLEVRESNYTARALYEKLGFENLGIRKNFYSLPTEHACIYTFFFSKISDLEENHENFSD